MNSDLYSAKAGIKHGIIMIRDISSGAVTYLLKQSKPQIPSSNAYAVLSMDEKNTTLKPSDIKSLKSQSTPFCPEICATNSAAEQLDCMNCGMS